ncbi:MAG: hypothetical protein F6K24_28860 [Okeania sp. SIO2D1]|nr:hypothetical protein [Okeania sp. SIO2D1]
MVRLSIEEARRKREEGRGKKEEGKRKKWMVIVFDKPLRVYKPQTIVTPCRRRGIKPKIKR